MTGTNPGKVNLPQRRQRHCNERIEDHQGKPLTGQLPKEESRINISVLMGGSQADLGLWPRCTAFASVIFAGIPLPRCSLQHSHARYAFASMHPALLVRGSGAPLMWTIRCAAIGTDNGAKGAATGTGAMDSLRERYTGTGRKTRCRNTAPDPWYRSFRVRHPSRPAALFRRDRRRTAYRPYPYGRNCLFPHE